VKALTCADTRCRLGAFHDEELPVSDQIAVGAHLEWCDGCAAELAELRTLRQMLRLASPGRATLSEAQDVRLQDAVMSRLSDDRPLSVAATARELFGDKQVVYAGLTAAAAMVACVLSGFGIMRFATTVHPDSLAALMQAVPPPGSNENPVPLDAYMIMPRALDQAFSTASAVDGSDSEFMLVAVVTREGTVTNLELHHATSQKAAGDLMGAVSQARFEPATVDGLPVAVNMVWLVTNTTVHPNEGHSARAKRRIA
jgi:hypothetical protein